MGSSKSYQAGIKGRGDTVPGRKSGRGEPHGTDKMSGTTVKKYPKGRKGR